MDKDLSTHQPGQAVNGGRHPLPQREIVAQWLASLPVPRPGETPSPVPNGEKPIALHVVATEALGLRKSDLTRREEHRIAKILRYFGYEKSPMRENGVLAKRWLKTNPSTL